MTCFVYVLKSDTTGRFYIGSGEDVDRRLTEHNAGRTTSTRGARPWSLYWSPAFESRLKQFDMNATSNRSKAGAPWRTYISSLRQSVPTRREGHRFKSCAAHHI